MAKLTKKQIDKRIRAEYPKGTDLIYIDYRDNLDESKEALEELATTGFIDEYCEYWDTHECERQSINDIIANVFTEEEAEEINYDTDLWEGAWYTCLEIDTSDPTKEILKNTSLQFFYYDTGLEIEPLDFSSKDIDKKIEQTGRKIANTLRIQYNKHRAEIDLMVSQAGYGGQLVILFTAKPIDLFGESSKYITFKDNYAICIMDRGQGSGDFVNFNRRLTFKFIRENLHHDDGAEGYSFSGDVCGLCKFDECDFVQHDIALKSFKVIDVKENEEAKAFAEREKRYQKTYDEGKCTAGDMKYDRHRNKEYINDYPCGTKCKDCGTFWID